MKKNENTTRTNELLSSSQKNAIKILPPHHSPQKLNDMAGKIAQHYSSRFVSPVIFFGILRLIESGVLTAVGLIFYFLFFGMSHVFLWYYVTVIVLTSGLMIAFLEFADLYERSVLRHPIRNMAKIFLSWLAVFAVLSLVGFFFKISNYFSRFWFASWFVYGLISIIFVRVLVAQTLKQWSRNGKMERRVLIVGSGEKTQQLIRSIEIQPDNDIRICGIFDDRSDDRSQSIIAGHPKLGTIKELIEFTRIARIDMIIVAIPISAEDRVLNIFKQLWVLPIDIRLSAHSNKLQFSTSTYSHIGSVPMLDVHDRPITEWSSVKKRIFDVFFSLIGIILLFPIMLLTAIAIKIDSKGPILFRQKRHGFNNEIIDVLKFRSMYTDQNDPLARNVVSKGDPRVTRVGRFIRKASIDELPQFFNALKGELSLVGPRPHAVYAQTKERMFSDVVEGYFARHKVKPGVTGWAQINGWRGEIDDDEKIMKRTEFDLFYIENWSLWFDLKILLLTPIRLLNTENAY
jgi:Undecaprenyl-phosphate glucose phosphotransferase